MQSASWRARQKTPQLGRYGQGLCSDFMRANSVCEVCRSLCVCVYECVHVWSVFVFWSILSFKLQSELHETLATDNHYFYAGTLLEY